MLLLLLLLKGSFISSQLGIAQRQHRHHHTKITRLYTHWLKSCTRWTSRAQRSQKKMEEEGRGRALLLFISRTLQYVRLSIAQAAAVSNLCLVEKELRLIIYSRTKAIFFFLYFPLKNSIWLFFFLYIKCFSWGLRRNWIHVEYF